MAMFSRSKNLGTAAPIFPIFYAIFALIHRLLTYVFATVKNHKLEPRTPVSSVHPAIKQYESEVVLSSADTGKPVPVRVVHLYLFENNSSDPCPVKVKGVENFVNISHKITPDPSRMTHYFVTLGEGIAIQNLDYKKGSE